MASKVVFGFGSLINRQSLKITAPNAHHIQPAYIKGFVRSFNIWDPTGFTTTNLDVKGIPLCALDIERTDDFNSRVNGVVFEVSEDEFAALQRRESEYMPVETVAYKFSSNEKIGECLVFSADKNNGVFNPDSAAQMRYLQVCLQGAKSYGRAFYQELLKTTFIDGRSLNELPDLLKLAESNIMNVKWQ